MQFLKTLLKDKSSGFSFQMQKRGFPQNFFKGFAYFLGTTNSRKKSWNPNSSCLKVRAISTASAILSQRSSVSKLAILGVFQERPLQGSSCSESSDKTAEMVKEGLTYQISCMTSSVLLAACLNKIIIIGQHFFRSFKDIYGFFI